LQPFGELVKHHDEARSDNKSDSPQLVQATLDICNAAVNKENSQKMTSAFRSVRRGGPCNSCRFAHASLAVF